MSLYSYYEAVNRQCWLCNIYFFHYFLEKGTKLVHERIVFYEISFSSDVHFIVSEKDLVTHYWLNALLFSLNCVITRFYIFIKSYICLCFIVVSQIFHIDELRVHDSLPLVFLISV